MAKCSVFFGLLLLGLFCGCFPMVKLWSPLPENAPAQLAHQVDCRVEMLLILLVTSGDEIVLGNPVPISYPFTNLTRQFSGHQIGMFSAIGGIGDVHRPVAFLLIGSDGVLYDIDVEDMPDKSDTDMIFYRATLSREWLSDFQYAMTHASWRTSGLYRNNPNCTAKLWYLFSIEALNPMQFRWEHPDQALPIVADFMRRYPFRAVAGGGRWVRVWRPRFVPNVFCPAHRHELPSFTAAEVLVCRDRLHQTILASGDFYWSRELALSNGASGATLIENESEITDVLKSGKYKIMAYVPLIDKKDKTRVDPERERHLDSLLLRRLAVKYRVPLVILSPIEPDSTAPQYPGIPVGLRQYWQCPDCSPRQ